MRNDGLEEAQAGIKIVWRNNSLRYANDTMLMAENEEELKSLSVSVKEESEKVGLKLNIQKNKIMSSGHITSWQIYGKTVETVSEFIFLGSKITADGETPQNLKLPLLETYFPQPHESPKTLPNNTEIFFILKTVTFCAGILPPVELSVSKI